MGGPGAICLQPDPLLDGKFLKAWLGALLFMVVSLSLGQWLAHTGGP